MMVLSGDPPRSRVLSIVLIVIIAALAVTPLVFPGAKAMNVATKICIFAALVASYDLLLGYTGSVSFAHTMFYGIGSYSVAIALYSMGPGWAAVATGIVIGLPLALLLALAIGLFSLRVEAIFFAMITLAVASAFLVLASQLSWLTGGEDGRSFQLPELLRPGTVLISKGVFGFELNGRVLTYYLIFAGSAAMILALLRVVNSPFGRVLQAIRENRFRAEALGFRTVFHLTYANCIAALVAANDRAREVHKTAGLRTPYWDWTEREGSEHYRKYAGTAPVHLLFALRQSIDMLFEEKLENVFLRHRLLAGAVRRAVAVWTEGQVLGFNVAEPAERSDTVTTVVMAGGHDPVALHNYCKQKCGVVLGVGIGELQGQAFRIAHMGHVNAPMILGTLGVIEVGLNALGIPHGKGGTEAAIEWLGESVNA